MPIQQLYDQLGTDIRFICPRIKLAASAVKGFGINKVYIYIMDSHLSHKLCIPTVSYCPKYAFMR
eukprot:UN08461